MGGSQPSGVEGRGAGRETGKGKGKGRAEDPKEGARGAVVCFLMERREK